MTPYLFVPFLFALAVVQASAVPYLAIWGVFPDLPLLFVTAWALLNGTRQGVLWGFVAGLALDLLSGVPFGALTLSLMAVGFASGLGATVVFRAQVMFPVLFVFLATVLYDLILLLMVQLSGDAVSWSGSLLRIVLPSAALNALLAPVVLWVLKRLNGWLASRKMAV